MTTHHTHGTPPDLRAIEQAVDDLAQVDRVAPAGMADRVFAASVAALPQARPGLRLTGSMPSPTPARRPMITWGLRLAAAVAIVSGAAALLTALRPATPAGPTIASAGPASSSAAASTTGTTDAAAESILSVTLTSLAALEPDAFESRFSEALAEADRLDGLVSSEPGDPSEWLNNPASGSPSNGAL